MEFRLAKPEDKSQIDEIYEDGSNKLRKEGINQWQGVDKPNTDNLEQLIKDKIIYVVEDENKIVSTALIYNYDIDYESNLDGDWVSDGPYISIHRVGTISTERNKGYGRKILELCENYAKENNFDSIRIDTHEMNTSMQRLLKSLDYNHCGFVYLGGINKRIAFEKIIK
ncbi:GNAT family N-acetyltransferase [Peptoniphilus sp. MSJ-1]|uniref:GNAT family N-acetyltransferase n=1 Tax=Peptoniphilus ovalis TaxID=2841503 RepID=A0ABS6FJK6_9FIRM|nr:GNAT family N-acetyltransferase [Peptoniphilus ovalis]MBU5669436.1 GNAT family N-acetyltransferase [Peptoniphilus ovalis]